jgi:hypothetical protein
MPSDEIPRFEHGQIGLTRFPPNVEQLSVVRDVSVMWLVARRNDVELRFPLTEEDCVHLANLLIGQGRARCESLQGSD